MGRYDSPMPDSFFRKLSDVEAEEARQWARDNYSPTLPENFGMFHPVVRDEWRKIEGASRNDHDLLLAIQELLDGVEWNSGMLEQIAEWLTCSGYPVRDTEEKYRECDSCNAIVLREEVATMIAYGIETTACRQCREGASR